MRKFHSSTTNHYQMVWRKLNQLRDARIDAAVVEYTELITDIDNIDFNDLDRRIAEAKAGGFPPEPKWRKNYRTVEDVPEAKGKFTW